MKASLYSTPNAI